MKTETEDGQANIAQNRKAGIVGVNAAFAAGIRGD